jgi:NADH dehydrogenase
VSDTKKIVVLGGGYGGVHAVKTLYKAFKKDKSVEITLIDRNPYHTLMTELHEIAGHRTEPEAVQVSFKRIFGGKRINVISDEVQGIDFEDQVIKSRSYTYEYDYLVLATGGQPEFFGVPGIQENSFTLWSLEDAIRIREHVELMFREAAKEPNAEIRAEILNFVIAGAGFTGMELAGELLELRDVLCAKYHIDASEVKNRHRRSPGLDSSHSSRGTAESRSQIPEEKRCRGPPECRGQAGRTEQVHPLGRHGVQYPHLCVDLRYPRFRVHRQNPADQG